MDARGAFIARLIETSPRAFASGAIDRSKELRTMVSESKGFYDALGDIELRLLHLAQALAVGRRQIFVDDVAWTKAARAARNLDFDFLEHGLRGMAAELGERLPPSHAAMAVDFIEATLEEFPGLSTDTASWLVSDQAQRFADALVSADETVLKKLADDHLASGGSAAGFCAEVIAPAQREVGRLWHIGQLDSGTEHIGSRLVANLIERMRDSISQDLGGRRVLIGCSTGESHEIGPRMAALAFSERGWNPTCYGASLPAADLVRMIELRDPTILVLSVQLPLNLTNTANLIAKLREANLDLPILVGGAPLQRVPDLWSILGASGDAGSITSVVDAAEAALG